MTPETEMYVQVGFFTALIIVGVACLRYLMGSDD